MDFLAFIGKQKKAVREAFELHEAGLRKALKSERLARKMTEGGQLHPGAMLEADFSFGDTVALLLPVLEELDGQYYIEIVDLFPDAIVYRHDWGRTVYRRSYEIDDSGTVTFGEREQVVRQYVVVTPGEGDEEDGDVVAEAYVGSAVAPLTEAFLDDAGNGKAKLISPGWGSSGYYSPEVLERDGPAVFRKGLQMYWDHSTVTEQFERPERSLRDLAGVLEGDAEYLEDGPDGAGLYAPIHAYTAYHGSVQEMGDDIGLSINARGKKAIGEAEGRRGEIITALTSARSVDYVTQAGRDGKVLTLFESKRGLNDAAGRDAALQETGKTVDENSEDEMKPEDKKKFDELQEKLDAAETETARLREADVMRAAKDYVVVQLGKHELPATTKKRLTENLSASPTLREDGSLNVEAYQKAIKEAVDAEVAYLKEMGSSTIKGMGLGGDGGDDGGEEPVEEIFTEAEVDAAWETLKG